MTDSESTLKRKKRKRRNLFVVIPFLMVLATVAVSAVRTSLENVSRTYCAGNLRQIGQAILLYSNEYGGTFPDSLSTTLVYEDITPEVFICPNTSDTKIESVASTDPLPKRRTVASWLTAGGHCSYIYIGDGLSMNKGDLHYASDDTIIAFEPMANHGGDGMYALFGDGHVSFIDHAQSELIHAAYRCGKRPILMPTSLPSTQP